jgi:serine/threonine protein kinase
MKLMRVNRVVCFTRPYLRDQEPAEVLSKVESAAASPSELIKEITNRNEVKRTLRVNIVPWGDLCLYEYNWDLMRVVASPFRLSRGKKIWKFYDEIVRHGIFVPEPVLLLEMKSFLFTTKTYVATQWIDAEFSPGNLGFEKKPPESSDLQSILFECVDAIANLHNAGFIHGDLKWSNLLCVRNRARHVALIDLDSLRKTSSILAQGRDFARFLIPPKNYQLKQDMIDGLTERYLGRRGHSGLLKKIIRADAAKGGKR